MSKKKKGALIFLGVFFVVLLVYLAFGRLIPGLITVLKSGNEKQIENYLAQSGRWDGIVCVFLLQFLQVVSIFFPGWPIQVASGIIYGGFRAFLITFLSYWTANMTVFILVRQMKNPADSDKRDGEGQEIPEKGIRKISRKFRVPKKIKENSFITRVKQTHPGVAVAMGVLMPGIPNGFIPYIAAGTSLEVKQFGAAVAGGGFFPILMTCLAGHSIITGDYLVSGIMLACPIVLVVALYKNQYRIIRYLENEKQKNAKES